MGKRGREEKLVGNSKDVKNKGFVEFPGGPVVRTPRFHC